MFEVFFLHFSEVTLQALLISAAAKLLQGTKDSSKSVEIYTKKLHYKVHNRRYITRYMERYFKQDV